MKFLKSVLAMLMVTIIITSCKKEPEYDLQKQLAAEEATIKAYLANNNITAVRHESGIYYVLSSPGTGSYDYDNFEATSITVKYSGKLLNGYEFDANTSGITFGPPEFPRGLNNLIDAWRFALAPKSMGGIVEGGLQDGGRIRIISPSIYCYGSSSTSVIPANSILDFDIELLEVKN